VVPAALFVRQQPAAAANMTLTILDGFAEVARGGDAFARVGDGHVLNPGDRVRTTDRSHAVVTFLDGSTVEIEPATTTTPEPTPETTPPPPPSPTPSPSPTLGAT